MPNFCITKSDGSNVSHSSMLKWLACELPPTPTILPQVLCGVRTRLRAVAYSSSPGPIHPFSKLGSEIAEHRLAFALSSLNISSAFIFDD